MSDSDSDFNPSVSSSGELPAARKTSKLSSKMKKTKLKAKRSPVTSTQRSPKKFDLSSDEEGDEEDLEVTPSSGRRRGPRLSPDEKLFQRQLQAALEESRKESANDSTHSTEVNDDRKISACSVPRAEDEKITSGHPETAQESPPTLIKQPQREVTENADNFPGRAVPSKSRPQRQKKRPVRIMDESSDSDEDFKEEKDEKLKTRLEKRKSEKSSKVKPGEGKPVPEAIKRKSPFPIIKEKPVKKSKIAEPLLDITPNRSATTPRSHVQSPLLDSNSTTPSPSSGSVTCLAKTQGWRAPRFSGTPTSSGGGGGANGAAAGSNKSLTPRLGLSRGFKAVKPLHTNVKIS